MFSWFAVLSKQEMFNVISILLPHFRSMFSFYTPWKTREPNVFWGCRNGTLAWNGFTKIELVFHFCSTENVIKSRGVAVKDQLSNLDFFYFSIKSLNNCVCSCSACIKTIIVCWLCCYCNALVCIFNSWKSIWKTDKKIFSSIFSEIENHLTEIEQDKIEFLWEYFEKGKEINNSRTKNNFKKENFT